MCQISEGTNLVRNLIPCYRNSDNVVGLYDIVNNVFYTNDGTGDFIAGPVVSELIKTKAAFVKDLLPTGYIRLSYIENPDENAYINTSIVPDDTTGFKVHMSVRDITTDLYYLGARESNQTNSRFGLGVYQGHTYMALGTYYSNVTAWTITSGTPFVAENNYKNSRVATMNGLNPVSVGTLSGITVTRSIYLFKSNMPTTQLTDSCRIYDCEITQGTTIVAHFIPCLDNNGVACMYDTIRKQTFYSAGTGTFSYDYIPDVELPTGYTQLKYIASDGDQYIDTGYLPIRATDVMCDFTVSAKNQNLLNYVYGEYNSSATHTSCGLYISSSDVFGVLFGSVDANSNISRAFNTKYSSRFNRNTLKINDSVYTVGSNNDFTSTNSVYLFKGNGSSRPGLIGKINYWLVRENSVVVRYMIPCINDQNEVGMYDIMTNTFYGNRGTGNFTYEEGVYEDLPTNNVPITIQLFNFN